MADCWLLSPSTRPLIPNMTSTEIDYLDDSEKDCGAACAQELGSLLDLPPIGCVDLMVTTKCNMRCDYCFVEGKDSGNTMSADIARRAIEFIFRNLGNRQEVEIVLFGGEPLLCFPLIRDIIVPISEQRAAETQKRVTFSMTTNGTLLNKERLEFLRDHKVKFLISIDGLPETHDKHRRMLNTASSAELILRQVTLFKRFQPWLGARMTIHPDAVGSIAANVRGLYCLGFNQVIIGPAFGAVWTEDALVEYDRQMLEVGTFYKTCLQEKLYFRIGLFERDLEAITGNLLNAWGCGAGAGRIAITPTGAIFGCAKLATLDGGRGRWRLGSIEEGFTRVGTRLSLMAPPVSSRKQCLICAYAAHCRGGCPATNYSETGSPVLPSKLDCWAARSCTALHKSIYEISPSNTSIVVTCLSDELCK